MNKMFLIFGAMALGAIFPTAAQAQEAQQCREFTRDIVIDGKTVEGVGNACLQDDGSWRIVSSEGVGREVVFVEPREEIIVVQPRKRFVRYPSASFGYRSGYGYHGGFHGRSHRGYGHNNGHYGRGSRHY